MDEQKECRQGQDKLEPGSVTSRSGALRRLDNFWYHYKWPVLAVTFFAVILVVCMVQMMQKDSYDVTLIFGGGGRMNSEERAALDQALGNLCPQDYDGDGNKRVQFVAYEIYSDEEWESMHQAAIGAEEEFSANPAYSRNELKNFNMYIAGGEATVCLVSPYLYDNLKAADRVRPLAEVYGADPLPQGAMEDGCGVRLGDTDWYQNHSAAQAIPENQILCLLRPSVMGPSHDETIYAHSVAFFRALADFVLQSSE